MKVFGSRQCPDTLQCLSDLDKAGVQYEFCDLAELSMLKEFIKIRDTSPLYDSVKARGGLGIPLLVKDDQSLSFEWSDLI